MSSVLREKWPGGNDFHMLLRDDAGSGLKRVDPKKDSFRYSPVFSIFALVPQ
jgi:hypothetical protein